MNESVGCNSHWNHTS